MDNNLNVTYLTLDGYVEVHKYRYLYFVIMFTAYILIICFNSTIVCLIVIHKNLHDPMYIFIAALLMNSVLLSTALYPKILTDVLSEKQIISYSACLFQWFIYFFLARSEFLLLAAMAYDRYVSICKPLQYPTIMHGLHGFCLCQISGAVSLSADAKFLLYVYGLVVLVNFIFLPVLFILFTYIRIFIITYQCCREVRRKAAQTCLPHLIVLINYSCLLGFHLIIARLETDFPPIVRLIMALESLFFFPGFLKELIIKIYF
uniref:G-protein coupled receptors family 1 profile domain-containing protein n=1 Tax=Mastacembelus armatus TaxID=205130 RepID=A0A3Q3MZ11_9TELE